LVGLLWLGHRRLQMDLCPSVKRQVRF
jgi:hypothetical protein